MGLLVEVLLVVGLACVTAIVVAIVDLVRHPDVKLDDWRIGRIFFTVTALGSLYEIYQHLGPRPAVFAALGFAIGEIGVRHRLRAGNASKLD